MFVLQSGDIPGVKALEDLEKELFIFEYHILAAALCSSFLLSLSIELSLF